MVSLPPPHDDEPAADGLEVLFDIDGGKFTYDLIEIVLAHVEKENQELGTFSKVGYDKLPSWFCLNAVLKFSIYTSCIVLTEFPANLCIY